MDAHVQRAQLLGDDALEIGLGEPSERRVVAVKERQPVVVVLHVEAAAQAGRQLVDEAELAVVVARAHLIEERGVHLDAEGLPGALHDLEGEVQPAPDDLELDVGLVGEQLPLDHVTRRLPIDDLDAVADLDSRHLGRRAGRDSDDSRRGHLPRIGPVPCISMVVDRVLLASPRGFCAGVEMAIKALAWMVRAFEPPVYCYHEIVHNKLVVDRFTTLGVVFVDDVHEVPEGAPSCSPPTAPPPRSSPRRARRAATSSTRSARSSRRCITRCRVRAGKGYRIVYVGHQGHEEAVGTMAVAPEAMYRVESAEDVLGLPDLPEPIAVLAQTTLSHRDWAGALETARERWPNLWVPGRSDLCFATTNRQSALMAMAPRCDAIVVIGSANSSNTRALEKLAIEAGCPSVHRVNSVDELPETARRRWRHRRRVGSGGAHRSRDRSPRPRARASRRFASPRRTSTSLPLATSAILQAAIEVAATVVAGGSLAARPAVDDREIAASDVLEALRA